MNEVNEVLLCKFIAGEATPHEAILVNDWIDSSEENRIDYVQLERTWAVGKINKKQVPLQKASMATLPPSRNGIEKKSIQSFLPLYKIAAAVLLLLSASSILYFIGVHKTETGIAWETKQTLNEVAGLSLPDGSSVTLNRNSTIKWPKGLPGDSREILLNGEAFFDVAHDPNKPFFITVDEIKIKVLGTAFNVHHDKEKDVIETDVIRGKVMMYTSEKKIFIDAGMTGVYRRKTNELVLLTMKSKNAFAYATHSLSFSAAPLEEVVNQLSKTYGVKFIFENKKITNCKLTTEYHNKSLSFIMNVISESLGLTYYIKDNIVYISGDGCL